MWLEAVTRRGRIPPPPAMGKNKPTQRIQPTWCTQSLWRALAPPELQRFPTRTLPTEVLAPDDASLRKGAPEP
eukprot:6268185-Pyramimonas_sp.AAC.1